MSQINKKLFYLSIALILALFVVSSCSQARGGRIKPPVPIDICQTGECNPNDNQQICNSRGTAYVDCPNNQFCLLNSRGCEDVRANHLYFNAYKPFVSHVRKISNDISISDSNIPGDINCVDTDLDNNGKGFNPMTKGSVRVYNLSRGNVELFDWCSPQPVPGSPNLYEMSCCTIQPDGSCSTQVTQGNADSILAFQSVYCNKGCSNGQCNP